MAPFDIRSITYKIEIYGSKILFNDIYYKNKLKGILGPLSFPHKVHFASL